MLDVYEIRKNFPMLDGKMMQNHPLVFLDNASTTFKPYQVIKAMDDYYMNFTSNAHRGDYDLCFKVDTEILNTRNKVAKFINSKTEEVVFTSGDTESLNLVAFGYVLKFLNEGDGILISKSEHASNSIPWFKIAEMKKLNIYFVDMEDNLITPKCVEDAFKNHDNIKFVSFAHVGNVLGYKIDIKEIAKICHKHNALICVDGAQSVPHTKTDFKDLDIDFLTFSAHKMCGPTGVGVLVGKYDILQSMDTFITGGGMNETFKTNGSYIPYDAPRKFEAGTQNIAGIIGFGAAIDFLSEIGMDNIEKHEEELHEYLLNKVKDLDNIIIYNNDHPSHLFTYNKKGVFAQDEGTLMNSKGIAVRSGQHCAKMIDEVIEEIATVRASFYLYTSKEDIDVFADALINGGDILDAYFNF